MKRKTILSVVMLLACLPLAAQVSNNNEDEVYKVTHRSAAFDFVPGEVLVKFRDEAPVEVSRARGRCRSANNAVLDSLLQSFDVATMEKVLPNEQPGRPRRQARAFNGTIVTDCDLSQLYHVRLSDAEPALRVQRTVQLVEQLEALPEVEYAEPNYRAYIMGEEVIASNPGQNSSYPLQWGIPELKINELWSKPIVNAQRPAIAILDTGVDTTHPDLKDNCVEGYDFVNDTVYVRDNNAHGTHVAGIAAAVDNGEGIIGANPRALIMPVAVMQSDGTGDIATIIKGIDFAVQHGATVINMSLGTYSNSRAMRQALGRAYQTAVIVAAAGNDAQPIAHKCDPNNPNYGPMFPAAYSFVLGVQATRNEGGLALFSNYDCDGPNYSDVNDSYGNEGCNYEMSAPGTGILSTVPGGGYRQMNGTSMAAPLIAGAISALQMVKDYNTQEELWGDLLHTGDFLSAYNITDRPAELDLIGLQFNDRQELTSDDEPNSSGDGRIDAGETIKLYPILRTVFGEASNIKLHLEVGEYEDASLITITENDVDFGYILSPYGKNVSQNPIVFKTKGNIANGRHLNLKLMATCDNISQTMAYDFTVTIDNMTKIGGTLTKDLTLTADKEYLVSSSLAIPEGITITIEPGTTINFTNGTGISCAGTFIAQGTPEKHIIMKSAQGEGYWDGLYGLDVEYCDISGMNILGDLSARKTNYINCHMHDNVVSYLSRSFLTRCNFVDNECCYGMIIKFDPMHLEDNNIIHNFCENIASYQFVTTACPASNNWIDSYTEWNYMLGEYSKTPMNIKPNTLPYFGTAKESILRPYVYEIGNDDAWYLRHNGYSEAYTYAQIDLTNMKAEPNSTPHGIVWKVVVNGYDAQDEYDELPPLGIGRHKFEVYYNRPMNKDVAPSISFGVREPYTQNAVNEDGSWNADGTVYTAYATITKKTASDGVNRIYVYGGEDDEFFECPYEKTRFNVNVQAAASMSTGFTATASTDHVNLAWDTSGADGIENAMGYNIYRYNAVVSYEDVYDDFGNKVWDDEADDWMKREIVAYDTIRINPYVIDVEATSYTDNAVKDGETYYYYYKLQGTNMKEYGMSNVVSARPTLYPPITLTAKSYIRPYGDANPEFGYTTEGAELMGGEPVITCEATVNSPVGTYPIVIKKGTMQNNYDKYVNGVLTIARAPLTITAQSYTRKQGEDNPDFEVDYEGWKLDETEAVLAMKPTVTCEATAESEPGEYPITVSGAEAGNYAISYVAGVLTVTEADPITLTARSYSRDYGEENPVFEYDMDGAALDGKPVITCEATASSPVGEYPIIITKGSVKNFNDHYVNGTLTITRVPLTVSVGNYEREQGEENPVFVISYEGWKLNDDETVLLAVPTATTEATADSPVGEYPITVSGGEAKNYNLDYRNGVLVVKVPSGITALVGSGLPFDIYTITGLLVRRQLTTLKDLPHGVYIINGQKVVVK